MDAPLRFDVAQLADWCARLLRQAGMPPEHAQRAARLLVRSEARGSGSHGLTRLPSYLERFAAGDFNPQPAITHRAFPGGIVQDADGALGHVAASLAIEHGLAALRDTATVLVIIRSCGHLGALGTLALEGAEAGALAVLGQSTPPVVALPGFSGAAIGTNPIAFGCPLPPGPPLVFDMSSSVAARGKVLQAARAGQPIPADWALDRDGHPTTDAQAALDGALQPAGGPKGIGIAMLVHCLSSGLAANADALAAVHTPIPPSGAVGRQSAFVWLVRPQAFAAAEDFAEQMQAWTGHYLARGGSAGRLPGAAGAAREASCRTQGVPLADSVLAPLRAAGARANIPFPSPARSAAP